MALKDKATGNTPEFEMGEGEDVGSPGEQAAAIKAKAQERLAAGAAKHQASQPKEETVSKSTSVATQSAKAGQVAVKSAMINPLEPLKNAFPVQFDTLRSLKVSSGNFVDNATGKALGDTIGLEILSFQDQWVISPGVDGDDGKEHVRYSDDGRVTSAGENCDEYLQGLKDAGYKDAKMSKRSVVAGAAFDIGEKGRKVAPDLQDSLVQISLAPTSKASFDRYQMDQAYKIGRGILEPAGADRVKIEATPASKGDKDWTIANFSRWVD